LQINYSLILYGFLFIHRIPVGSLSIDLIKGDIIVYNAKYFNNWVAK